MARTTLKELRAYYYKSLETASVKVSIPVKFVFGSTRNVLRRVGNATIEISASYINFYRAYKFFIKHGRDPISRTECLKSANTLQSQIELLSKAKNSNFTKKEIAEALKELEEIASFIKKDRKPYTPKLINFSSIRDEFPNLDKSPNVLKAMSDYNDALKRNDPKIVENTARILLEVIGAKGSKAFKKEINDNIYLFKKIMKKPNPKAEEVEKAVKNFYMFYSQLPADHMLRKVFDNSLQSAIDRNPDLWLQFVERALRFDPTTDMKIVRRGMVWNIKGKLGELLARNLPAYRKLWSAQMHRARLLAIGLGSDYKVVAMRSEIRATTKNGIHNMEFYDDGIFVVSDTNKEAFPIFVAQFKSGDLSSGTIIEQLKSDISREKITDAMISIDGKTYKLGEFKLEPPTRVIIGTLAPVELLPTKLLDSLNKLYKTNRQIGNPLKRLKDAIVRFDISDFESAYNSLSPHLEKDLQNELKKTLDNFKAAKDVIFIHNPFKPKDTESLANFFLETIFVTSQGAQKK